jgi:NADH:ubiquinone oxidoreductase subunit 5 (subunit L)/multisubunit Na+/H+ antiporter MnhA subunit
MEFSSGTVGAISAAIGVPIVFALLRNVKTLRHVAPDTTKDYEQLKNEYGKWEKLAPWLLLFFATVIGLALWRTLVLLAEFQASRLNDGEFLIYQPSIALALPSLFLAILLSVIPVHLIYLRLLGSERYAEYTEYENKKSGINSWKLLRYMAYVAAPVCVIFTLLTLDSYMKITESKVIVNPFFGVGEKEYYFENVETLKLVKSFKAPNGNIVNEPYFVIGFADGTEFNFHRTLHEIGIKEQDKMVSFISYKSNKGIQIDDPYPR